MSLGSRINEIRREKNLSIDDICAKSGIPKGTLSKITAGITTSPTLDTVRAIADALGCTLDDFDDNPKKKKAPSPPDEAKKVAERYTKLDIYGKAAVQAVMGEEEARIEAQKKEWERLESPLDKPEPKVIPLYWTPAAAGYASPSFGEDYDNYELKPEDPQGAVFAVKVSGDSMEPYFPDGSIVFCNRDEMADGDIGVFFLDGDSFIKQYYRDRMMGITYLFSLNRDRADADKVLPRSTGQTLVCFGRVITRRRCPLPGM